MRVIITDVVTPLIIGFAAEARNGAMDAKYFREKAKLCLRVADDLPLNNPDRFQLMDLADDFRERADELQAEETEQHRSKMHMAE